jgi:geranylgeranyl diphosphate synthase type I
MTALIDDLGGRAWAEQAAASHLAEALTHLHAADPEPSAAADLAALTGLVGKRER